MTYSFRTATYFIFWGTFYGLLLGAFAGTAIFPVFGTMYSVFWGTGVGAACGVLSGVITALIHLTSFHQDTDLDHFRRRLVLGIGVLTAVAAPIILYATSQDVLGGSSMMRDMAPWTALSLFAASFWGLLSSAYIASYYPAFIARLTTRREYEDIVIPQEQNEVSAATARIIRMGLPRWIFILAAVGVGLIHASNMSSSMSYYRSPNFIESVGYFAMGGLAGAIGLFFAGAYLAFGNAALLTFLKRLIFREYFPHLPPRGYRGILTLITFVFTVAVTWWSAILSPIIALFMAFIVYRTVALPDESIDKAKRKEKNALALEDSLTDNMSLLEEDEMVHFQEQRS